MLWTLVLFAYGGMGYPNLELTPVAGFQTQNECRAAGAEIQKLAEGTQKYIRFTCVRTDKI